MPAVNDEQLSWLMSRGTEMYRSMDGSLSMIISNGTNTYELWWMCAWFDTRTFVIVRDTLLDSIRGLAEDCFPHLSVNGHQGWQKPDLALGSLGARFCSPGHDFENPCANPVA